ncbi:MAG: methyltransferase domain-containing protein [bacterium]|nr:methyltransferase domain-containing protein [bacterium]
MWHRGGELLHPENILRGLGVRPGWHVGDLGCGSCGHFTFPAARLVGGEGRVYAVDIQRPALASIEKMARQAQLWNIHPIWSDLDQRHATAIPKNSLDLTVLSNTLYLAGDPVAMLEEALRFTRPGGLLLIIEWRKEPSVLGPPLNERLSDEEIFSHVSNQAHPIAWSDRFVAGHHHDGFVLQKGGMDQLEPTVLSLADPFRT